MQYKTIVLELLQECHPRLHERLRRERTLLWALNAYAAYLRARHHAWMEVLHTARPGSAPNQIASEALEMALAELEERLRHESSTDAAGSTPAEEAMAVPRRPTPPE
jgi:hypothetical protein